jgi:biopolymer transport protein ExbB/TolQ
MRIVIEIILTPLKSTMHGISNGLLIPTIAVLLFLLALSVVELGGFLIEIFTERRKRSKACELNDIFQENKDVEQINKELSNNQVFRRHRAVLNELIRQNKLSDNSLQALARGLLAAEERHYLKITDRTDIVTRLAPMFGLMGTLIPLGPGIIALSQGDTKTLAESLLIAFDTTVIGLTASGIAYVISRFRKRWYEEYLDNLEMLIESLLEVFDCAWKAEKRETQKF